MTRKTTLLIGLLVLSLGLIGWRVFIHQQHRLAQATQEPEQRTDYYMNQATIYQFDEAGQREYRMTLASALHFPDGSADLEDIYTQYQSPDAPPWDLSAQQGRMPPNSKDMHLTGGVKAQRLTQNDQIITAQTPNAWILGNTGIVQTGAHVVVHEPGRQLEGDGMHLDTNDNTLKLLQNVQSTILP